MITTPRKLIVHAPDHISSATRGDQSSHRSRKGPDWLKDAVIYQLYPQSFYDSNGDGIGDLAGIIQRLDYLQWLGVNCLWLNPIFLSPFHDAGYDIADFYRIAPRYGDRRVLKSLIDAAHRRGMHICLDLVVGHTSFEAAWFKQSCSARPNKYSDWYIWTDSRRNIPPNQSFITGWGQRQGGYLANYYFHQPALNYGYYQVDPKYPWQQSMNAPTCRRVKDELQRISAYWMDLGVDGFRVDMAFSCIKGDPNGTGIRKFWRGYRRWFQEQYPDGVLIAEWSQPDRALAAGFHIDMVLHYGSQLCWWELFRDQKDPGPGLRPGFFSSSGRGNIQAFLKVYLKYYQQTRRLGYLSLSAGNHDIPRPSYRRSPAELRVIHTMLLMLPGVPLLYYGDEIGMRYQPDAPNIEGAYHRAGSRTPMQWSRSRNAGFSTAPARRLYLPIDPSPDYPCVTEAQRDPDSLLHLVRQLLQLRHKYPALANDSDFSPVYAQANKVPFVFQRARGQQRIWVCVNPAAHSVTVRFRAPGLNTLRPLLCRQMEATVRGGMAHLKMAGFSYGIFVAEH